MTNFNWEDADTTDEGAASQDDASMSGLEDVPSAGDAQIAPDDTANDLDSLLEDVPEDQRDNVRKLAEKTARKLAGKLGPRIQNAEQRAEQYRQGYEQLLRERAASNQTTPYYAQYQAPQQDQTSAQVRHELEKLYPNLRELDNLTQIRQAAGSIIMSQYDLQLERYLDAGPGKAYGELFDTDRREYLKDIIRAKGYNINDPSVMKAQERVKREMQREVAARKAQARNRAQVGEDTGFSPSNARPDIAKVTPQGSFDWRATYQESARRRRRS